MNSLLLDDEVAQVDEVVLDEVAQVDEVVLDEVDDMSHYDETNI